MKFHNGCWLYKEGFGCFAPQQVYETRKGDGELVLCAPTSPIRHKGDTLGGINLTLRITCPAREVIRVQVIHHKGVCDRGPKFPLELPGDGDFCLEETKGTLTVRNGRLALEIGKKSWFMRYLWEGRLLTAAGPRDLFYIKENWKGPAYDRGDGAWMCQQLGLSVGEQIYGLGERFGPLVKNGQTVECWNEDGGTGTDQSYKNIPFYLSSQGYGVFVNHPEKVEFEIGTEQVSRTAFSVRGESLDYFFIGGPSMKDVLGRYTGLTGRPSLPPQWTFGLWLSTSFTTDYDEATVMNFINGMEERGIPLSVFHFDCCWMREFHWTDFIWDERVFPDPEGMLKRIKAKGIRICVWINPYIGQEAAVFDECAEKGYFVKRPDGSVWQWDMWQPGMALVDFTNPEAVRWYQEKLAGLLDMGVDCFKTDFGERIPTDVVYWNGADPVKMHNYYTYLYNQAVFQVLEEKRGRGEAVLFARSATAGGQKFPVHWGGDCWSDYPSMAESLRGGLSLTSSGFGFWSHDIGGFESQSTPDVYKRWAAFGLLSTHSRLHGSTSYRVPWIYDEEAVDVVRFFVRLKLSLMPYLYSSAVDTSRTGIPMMRAMALEFDQDPACRYLDRQYMLGERILTAPIFNEEGEASYYLPSGTWTSLLTGEETEGGAWRKEKHGYLSLPVWVRENTILPMGIQMERADDGFENNVELRVYALKTQAETVVYQAESAVCQAEAAGRQSVSTVHQSEIAVSQSGAAPAPLVEAFFQRTGDGVEGRIQGKGRVRIRFMNLHLSSVSGAEFAIQGPDTVIETEAGCSFQGRI